MRNFPANKTIVKTLTVLSVLFLFGTAQADGDECEEQDMITLAFVEDVVVGSATMCATPVGLDAFALEVVPLVSEG